MASPKRTTPATPPATVPVDVLRRIHADMFRIRRTDQLLLDLVRSGGAFVGPTYPSGGAEGSMAVLANLLHPEDWVCPTPREQAILLCRGVSVKDYVLSHVAAEDGINHGRNGAGRLGSAPHHVLPTLGSTASNLAVGLGLAMTMMWKKSGQVVAGIFGDGIINTGTWHEVINMLAVQRAPMVLVCHNNGIARGTLVADSSPTATLAERAEAYGMPFATVDGTDVEAMHAVLAEALGRARSLEGGTLVECVTTRLGPFSSLDETPDAGRPAGALDVLERLEARLTALGALDDTDLKVLGTQLSAEHEEAVRSAPGQARPAPHQLARGVYA